MKNQYLRKFRENIRHIERELDIQNNSNCSHGVSLPQCHTMLELNNLGTISLNELSEKLYLDKSTVSRTVNSLVKEDYVNRSIPEENRRSVLISLTEKGKKICNRINQDNDRFFSSILETVPEEDLPVFLRSFELVAKKMIQSNQYSKANC